MENKKFGSIDEILDFAMEKEREASEFYKKWADRVNNDAIKEVLLNFSKEEDKHEALIKEVKEGKKLVPKQKKVPDMKVSDYLIEVNPSEEMDYQKALKVAMQREKASFNLYNELADTSEDKKISDLFRALAQEEAKHKLRLETIYDDVAYPEN